MLGAPKKIQTEVWIFFLQRRPDNSLGLSKQSLEAHAAHTAHAAHITTRHSTASRWLVFSQFADSCFGCQQEAGN